MEQTGLNPPLPTAQSFLTCQEIFAGQRSGTKVLLAPCAVIPVLAFPAEVRLAVFAEFAGGHGTYLPQSALLDGEGTACWNWTAVDPFKHHNPLQPTEVAFSDLTLTVPAPGRYSLVLLLNGAETARRTLWIGSPEALRAATG